MKRYPQPSSIHQKKTPSRLKKHRNAATYDFPPQLSYPSLQDITISLRNNALSLTDLPSPTKHLSIHPSNYPSIQSRMVSIRGGGDEVIMMMMIKTAISKLECFSRVRTTKKKKKKIPQMHRTDAVYYTTTCTTLVLYYC